MTPTAVAAFVAVLSQEELANVRIDNNKAEPGYGVVAPVEIVTVGTVGGAVLVQNATLGGWYQYDPIVFAAASSPAVVCLGKLFVTVPPPKLCLAGPLESVWHCPDPQNSSRCFSFDAPGAVIDWASSHAVAWYGSTAVIHKRPDAFEDVRQMAFCVALLIIVVALRTFTGMSPTHERYAKNWAAALTTAVVVAAPVSDALTGAHLILVLSAAMAAGSALTSPVEDGGAKPGTGVGNVEVSIPPLQSKIAHIDETTTAKLLLQSQLGMPSNTTVLCRGRTRLHPDDVVVPNPVRLKSAQKTQWEINTAVMEQIGGGMRVEIESASAEPPLVLNLAYATKAEALMAALNTTCAFTRDNRPLGLSSPLLGPLSAIRQLSHRDVSAIVAHAAIALSLPAAIGLAPTRLARFLIGVGILIDAGYQCERALWHVNQGHGVRIKVQLASLIGLSIWAAAALVHPSIEAAALTHPDSPSEGLISAAISLSAFVAGSLSWHV